MFTLALALTVIGADEDDGLDALLALPPPEDAVTLELRPEGPVKRRRLRGSFGALMLGTAEGNFPVPVLNTGQRTTVFGPEIIWLTDELLEPGAELAYPSVVATAEAEWFPTSNLSLRTFLTSGEIRGGSTLQPESDDTVVMFGLSPSEFFESGFWLAELALTVTNGPLTVELGRRFTDIAGGLIYQDVGTGIFLTLKDGTDGLALDGSLFAAGRDFDSLETPAPIAQVVLSYTWDWINKVEVFAASYWNRNGALTDVFVSTLVEAVIISQPANRDEEARQRFLDRFLTPLLSEDIGERARLTYAGATFDGQLGPLRLKSRFAICRGSFDTVESLESPLNIFEDLRVRISGYAVDLDASLPITQTLRLGAEGFGLSGFQTDSVRNQEYNSFIAVAPLWTYSTIFFTSGVNQTFTAARGSAAGINGHGVFGGGPTVDWTPEGWAIEGKVLALFADEPIDPLIGGGGDFYGIEPNLTVRLALGDGLALHGIGGLLFPGSFFPDDELAYRALVMLDGRFEL